MPLIRKAYKFRIKTNKDIESKLFWFSGSARFMVLCKALHKKVKNITLSNRAGRWFAYIQVEQMINIQGHPSDAEIGIDAGIKCFAAFSDGTKVQGVNSFRRHEVALVREQKKRISRLHQKIANVRSDFLQKLSTEISKNHARVYVEGLHIKNMSSSARGTMEDPGTRVKAKSGLNKSILDQGWGEFRRQLD